MRQKVARSALLVMVVCIFAFFISFGAYFIYKEKACAKSLYSADCYRTYEGFLMKYL